MLRRNIGTYDVLSWRVLSQHHDHGEYHLDVPDIELNSLVREVKEYENGFLTQQIAFLETIDEHFSENYLWHSRKLYKDQMRGFYCGKPITVMAYHAGQLKEHRFTNTMGAIG